MNDTKKTSHPEPIYEYVTLGSLHAQLCPVCKEVISDLPGTRDAVCHNCGFKDPCCE